MMHIKTPQQIETMRQGGAILHTVLQSLLKYAKPGVSLLELDRLAERLIRKSGGTSSFKRVKGYHWTICACVNDVVVHGIPTDYTIRKGDVLGIDCGVYYKGFHTDSAWTIHVGDTAQPGTRGKDGEKEIHAFLSTGERALWEAVKEVKAGNRIYDISKVIQRIVEGGGYSVVRTLVGHGVGRQLHEEPEVPGYVRGEREKTPELVEGLVLAIEVIYNMGSPDVVYRGDDGWTIVTKDGKISGLFEMTVAVTSHGCVFLT